jgi:hypothetical protein
MKTKQLALGDFLQELLSKFHYSIKDQELLDSLNETKLIATEGLELIYHIDKPIALPQIAKVSAQEILQEVNQKEEQVNNFAGNMLEVKGKDDKRYLVMSAVGLQNLLMRMTLRLLLG